MRSYWKITALVTLSVYGLCVAYTELFNAEVCFWSDALKKKTAWIAKMDEMPGPKVVFAGGSTTLFAIPSRRLYEKQSLQTVNMGMTVGMGTPFLVALAYEAAQPGDTMVLLLEPNLLSEGRLEPTALSVQTALRAGMLDRAFGHPLWALHVDAGLVIGSMRPGAYHVITALLKAVFHRPAYRYPQGNVDESGYLSMPGVDPEAHPFAEIKPLALSSNGKGLLQYIKAQCDKKNVALYYSLPWVLSDSKSLEQNRRVCRDFTRQVSEWVPVLEDNQAGCSDDPALFYDQVHLSAEGAERRVESLVEGLGLGSKSAQSRGVGNRASSADSVAN